MRGDRPRRRGRRLSATLLSLALLLTGCTYSESEPGLFGRSPAAPTPTPTRKSPYIPASDSAISLPVLGEAIYRTTGRLDVSVRIAVHAVRRILGGTVLDWSLTALEGPSAVPGEQLALELGLTEAFDVSLIDPTGGLIYRPLISRRSGSCLCVPAWLVGQTMLVNAPRLLQTTFPRLPNPTRMVDVNIDTVPIFSRIPVTPAGHVQTAVSEIDLARPAELQQTPGGTEALSRPSGQSFAFEVDAVLASGSFTSVVWTVRARGPGPGSIGSAHPQIRRAGVGPTLRPQRATFRFAGERTVQCLCPKLGNFVGRLQKPGDHVSVVTNFPALPLGTTSVDVLFPWVDRPVAAAVTPAPEGAFRAGALVPAETSTWSYVWNRPQAAWSLARWPTPVPAPIDDDQFRSVIDRIIR